MRPLLVRNSQWWNFEQQSQSLKQRYRSFELQFIRVKNRDNGVSKKLTKVNRKVTFLTDFDLENWCIAQVDVIEIVQKYSYIERFMALHSLAPVFHTLAAVAVRLLFFSFLLLHYYRLILYR